MKVTMLVAYAMKQTSFQGAECPLGRALERVGDAWNLLILREAFYGSRRFSEYQNALRIPTNTLSRRLDNMVDAGLLTREPYTSKPPRFVYVPTQVARDFRPILLAMLAWGNRHFAKEGRCVEIVDCVNGAPVEPVVVDRASGRPLGRLKVIAGPAASSSLRQRLGSVGEIE